MKQPLVPVRRFHKNHFAVELKETRFKEIQDFEQTTEIRFNWESVIEDIKLSNADITIELTKKNADLTNLQIKNFAKAICDTRDIDQRDIIFGIQDRKIQKVGFVTAKFFFSNTFVALEISWADREGVQEAEMDFFRDNLEIQSLNLREVHEIEQFYGPKKLQNVFNSVPVTQFLPPDIRLIHRNDYFEERQFLKQEPGGTIRLFYGTSRNALAKTGNKQTYGNELDKLETGICEVSIPRGHIQGDMERPKDFWVIKFIENRNMHVMVQTVEPLDLDAFMDYFSQTVRNTPKKSALLFVHGYNNSFEDAARRSAQIAYDLPFDGFAGFFSWPSDAKVPFYLSDEASARSTTPVLVEFLENLISDPELEELHIIAHSMGSLVTTLSLNTLRINGNVNQYLHKIHQLILGAPDIDQTEFRNTILPTFKNIGIRRTIYASDHDFPLGFSRVLRIGRFRLGQSGENVFLDKDLDSIEASNLVAKNSHGYLFESRALLTDLFFLITQNLSPAQRRLREVRAGLLRYWLFVK